LRPFVLRGALAFGAFVRRVPFGRAHGDAIPRNGDERMGVDRAIHPRPPPGPAVDDQHAFPPVESRRPPAPRGERRPDSHAIAETDSAADEDARPRAHEYDGGVVIRHGDEARVDGQDFDERPVSHDHLGVGSQIAIASRDTALPLDGVHHSVG
jgi:hypothetical protein